MMIERIAFLMRHGMTITPEFRGIKRIGLRRGETRLLCRFLELKGAAVVRTINGRN